MYRNKPHFLHELAGPNGAFPSLAPDFLIRLLNACVDVGNQLEEGEVLEKIKFRETMELASDDASDFLDFMVDTIGFIVRVNHSPKKS